MGTTDETLKALNRLERTIAEQRDLQLQATLLDALGYLTKSTNALFCM